MSSLLFSCGSHFLNIAKEARAEKDTNCDIFSYIIVNILYLRCSYGSVPHKKHCFVSSQYETGFIKWLKALKVTKWLLLCAA